MKIVQLSLPDDLAHSAAIAGLLSGEAMEHMLREQLRRKAGETLQSMWKSGPPDAITSQIEQEIVEEVRKARAHRRVSEAS